MKKIKTIALHIAYFLIYYVVGNVAYIISNGFNIMDILGGFTSYALLALVFYFVFYFVNPFFIVKGKYWQASIYLFAFFFVYTFVRIYQLKLYNLIYPAAQIPDASFISIFGGSYYFYTTNLAVFLCFCLWQNSVKLRKTIIIHEKKVLELDTLNSKNELLALRAQINPHFLFNTLNLFYIKSLKSNTDLAGGILALSEIMRYALQPPSAQNNRVSLEEEISQMKNVIAINRMRLKGKMYLDFKVDGNPENIFMPPLILITLLENVFKHGAVHDPVFPSMVSLQIYNVGVLEFNTYNKKKGGLKDPSTGIGLNNIKKRLDFTYQDKYVLGTNDDGIFYSAKLIIDTNAAIIP